MGLTARLGLMPEYFERKAERIATNIDARMRELGASGAEVQVHNLSTHGFMAEADSLCPVGCYIWVKLPGAGNINARIIWRDSFRYGCEFITPIASEQRDAAIAMSKS